MVLAELSRLAAIGEGLHLEFKRKVPEPERIAKEMIALANTSGGKILIGVDDMGTVYGVKDWQESVFQLEESLSVHCDPPIAYEIETISVSRKRDALVVHVPDSKDKPHFLLSATNGRPRVAYVRVKDKSVEASRELIRVMRSRKNPRDIQFEFGDKEQTLMRYLDRYERITVSQFAKLADIPRRIASHTLVLLTKAEILHLHPSDQEDFFTLAFSEPASETARRISG